MNDNPENNDSLAQGTDNWWESFLTSDSEMAGGFREGIVHTAYQAYQDAFGHLPGSTRTSRLRKKRNTRIVNWYFDEYLPRQATQPETDAPLASSRQPEGEYSIDNILNLVESLPTPDNNGPAVRT